MLVTKKYLLAALLIVSGLLSFQASGQQSLKEHILESGKLKDTFQKNFHWGLSMNMYWSSITGEQVSDSYFYKPSIGGMVRAEYYFSKVVGVGLGAGFQQLGAGLKNSDVTGGAYSHPWITSDLGFVGNLDSTYLERLRFSTVQIPITIHLRTKHDVLQQGMRLSGSAGALFIHNSRVNQTYQSSIDGDHPYNWVTDNYVRNQWGYQITAGTDIDSGGGGSMFQVHFVFTQSLSNIYAKGQGDGRHTSYGVRISWMF